MKPFGYIYLIRNKVNGKVYVGQTVVDVASRWSKHLTHRNADKKKKYPLYNALKKYGKDSFDVVTLTTASSREALDLKERILIRAYKSQDLSIGYNCHAGGRAGGLLTPEAKAKISAANKGRVRSPETRALIGAVQRGRKQSPETIAKRFANAKGRKLPARSAEFIEKQRQAKLGKKQSEETKEKRAAKIRGLKRSPETIERIRQAALNRSQESRDNNRLGIINGHKLRRERQAIADQIRGVMAVVMAQQTTIQGNLFPE